MQTDRLRRAGSLIVHFSYLSCFASINDKTVARVITYQGSGNRFRFRFRKSCPQETFSVILGLLQHPRLTCISHGVNALKKRTCDISRKV